MLTANKKEFKHLDALRGIMAIYVCLVHFLILFIINKKNELVFNDARFIPIGQIGQVFMTVFFVLSGFLITYILLIEKEKDHTIHFKKFYLRRAFRILPMYYLAVFGIYFLYKKACMAISMQDTPFCESLPEHSFYYFAMLPNWAHAADKTLPHISNFWSIGAEEQFYIVWPIILYFTYRYVRTFLSIYIFYSILLIAMLLINNLYLHKSNELFIHVAKFFDYTRFGAFAFGGIIAYLILYDTDTNYDKLKQFISKKSTQWFCLLFPFFITIFPSEYVMFLKHIIVIPCCAVLIYNFAQDTPIFKLENKYWNYIGKISYSLYILNQIVIDIVIKICFGAHITKPLVVLIISISLLLICSAITYELIEKPFMKLRRYFG